MSKLFDPYNPIDSFMLHLAMYSQKSNIPLLKEAVMDLITMMTQKDAGQREDSKGINVAENFDMTIKTIIIEAVSLVLSGDLERLETEDEQ